MPDIDDDHPTGDRPTVDDTDSVDIRDPHQDGAPGDNPTGANPPGATSSADTNDPHRESAQAEDEPSSDGVPESVEQRAATRLAELGGTSPDLVAPPRRRPSGS